jgi:hypothetical protein
MLYRYKGNCNQFRPYEIARILSFQDGMRFADKLLTIDLFMTFLKIF